MFRKANIKLIIRSVLLVVLMSGATLVFDDIQRLYGYVPLHYIISCILLVVFYHLFYFKLTPQLLLKGSVFYYLLAVGFITIVYLYLPILICSLFPDTPFTISFLEQDLYRQAKIRFALLMYLALVLGSSILSSLADVQKSKARLEAEKTKAELGLLKSQVNPHFLFNSLNSIYFLTSTKDDRAPKALMALSDMMRYVLTEPGSDLVPLGNEINYIEKYISLQKLRIPNHTVVDVVIDVENESLQVAPMLLIPFVENAFKYGVSTIQSSQIFIQFTANANRLKFLVRNQIIPKIEKTDGVNIGIKNVARRLELVYPDAHVLDIKTTQGFYEVKLAIDLNTSLG
ncbi:sensor histidine kinase [Sediminicola luteus]|uniref:Signal transduction histidine kinase internal region domain-containing protein n=1 Tax=Sediminicola luteus TaxID=319238 RepID=A0A2A4G6Y1_9FLAO|nr:histidine kinase [Sediminicola luteus]PCE63730.1 hypothetical protein B7P33_10665 [Sediminicola luteus]